MGFFKQSEPTTLLELIKRNFVINNIQIKKQINTINNINKDGDTPLILALKKNLKKEYIINLIKNGADVNYIYRHKSDFYLNNSVFKLLIQKIGDEIGYSPKGIIPKNENSILKIKEYIEIIDIIIQNLKEKIEKSNKNEKEKLFIEISNNLEQCLYYLNYYTQHNSEIVYLYFFLFSIFIYHVFFKLIPLKIIYNRSLFAFLLKISSNKFIDFKQTYLIDEKFKSILNEKIIKNSKLYKIIDIFTDIYTIFEKQIELKKSKVLNFFINENKGNLLAQCILMMKENLNSNKLLAKILNKLNDRYKNNNKNRLYDLIMGGDCLKLSVHDKYYYLFVEIYKIVKSKLTKDDIKKLLNNLSFKKNNKNFNVFFNELKQLELELK